MACDIANTRCGSYSHNPQGRASAGFQINRAADALLRRFRLVWTLNDECHEGNGGDMYVSVKGEFRIHSFCIGAEDAW